MLGLVKVTVQTWRLYVRSTFNVGSCLHTSCVLNLSLRRGSIAPSPNVSPVAYLWTSPQRSPPIGMRGGEAGEEACAPRRLSATLASYY